MGEEFKPSLHELGQFDGKVKADYNEFTQYLTLVFAKDGRMGSFNGIVKDQSEVSRVVTGLLQSIGEAETKEGIEDAEVVEEEPKRLKKK